MTEKSLTDIFDINYKTVKENIAAAAQKVGKTADDIILLAAVKTVEPDFINYAVSKGIDYIGDNKVQELKGKEDFVTKNVHKHFIGHLQTNKVKDVVGRVEMIQSVDSLRLAQEISKQAIKKECDVDILLEINIGNEESKSGFKADELFNAVTQIRCMPGVKIKGLMAIPPVCDETQNREYFLSMKKLFVDIKDKNIDNVSMDILSMGMSDDYQTAIECGANLVRIGTLLFGRRIYKKESN